MGPRKYHFPEFVKLFSTLNRLIISQHIIVVIFSNYSMVRTGQVRITVDTLEVYDVHTIYTYDINSLWLISHRTEQRKVSDTAPLQFSEMSGMVLKMSLAGQIVDS